MGRSFGSFYFMNYPKTWLSNIFKYTMPESIQRRAHKSTVRRTNTLWNPYDFVKSKSTKLFKTIAKPFFSGKKWQSLNRKSRNLRENTLKIIYKAEKKVVSPASSKKDYSFGKTIDFTERARQRRLKKAS